MYSYLEASSLLDFDQTIAKPLFDGVKYPWEVLPKNQRLYYCSRRNTRPKRI